MALDDQTTSWVQWAVGLITMWLMTWGAWVTGRIMVAVPHHDFQKAKEKRDEEIREIITNLATKEDVNDLRRQIDNVRNLLISDLQRGK